MKFPPKLEYPLSRPFRWPWFTPVAYTLSLVVLAVLIVINVALVGYETVTVSRPYFNLRQDHWYNLNGRLQTKSSKSQCDPVLFIPGDTFTTNYNLFQWTFYSRGNGSEQDVGLAYSGSTLDSCDVTHITMGCDLRSIALEVNPIISCNGTDGFDFIARTSYSFRPWSFMGSVNSHDSLSRFANSIAQAAAKDFINRGQSYNNKTTSRRITALSLYFSAAPCPASLGPEAPCATSTPSLNLSGTDWLYEGDDLTNSGAFRDITGVSPNSGYSQSVTMKGVALAARGTEGDGSGQGGADANANVNVNLTVTPPPDELADPLRNLAQAFYAMARVDLGNASPNNFFVRRDALNATLNATFARTAVLPANDSLLYDAVARPDRVGAPQDILPLRSVAPAHLRVVYPCRVQRPKPVGSAIVDVLVATLSMFTAAWGGFMFLATTTAKMNDETANRCEGHLQAEMHIDSESMPLVKEKGG